MSLDRAPSLLISMLEIRGSRIFLNFLGGCKRTKSAMSLQWKRLRAQRRREVRAVDSIQGGCVLVPPHPQPSFTGDQSQSTGKHRNQLWMSQSLQRTTGNSRTSFHPIHTATRSSKPYFKKIYIYLVDCGES